MPSIHHRKVRFRHWKSADSILNSLGVGAPLLCFTVSLILSLHNCLTRKGAPFMLIHQYLEVLNKMRQNARDFLLEHSYTKSDGAFRNCCASN